jgi:hypothetical protein
MANKQSQQIIKAFSSKLISAFSTELSLSGIGRATFRTKFVRSFGTIASGGILCNKRILGIGISKFLLDYVLAPIVFFYMYKISNA